MKMVSIITAIQNMSVIKQCFNSDWEDKQDHTKKANNVF